MAVPPINYARRVLQVRDIHDGDTYRLLLDQGLGDAREMWVRLQGVDTWELSQPGGVEARDFVAAQFAAAHEIIIQTYKTKTGTDVMTFIRYVADVWLDGIPLADILRAQSALIKVVV